MSKKNRSVPVKSKERAAIEIIARMGHGIKESALDWANIGKNAVAVAKKVEAGECPTCHRAKVWEP